jgi:hypothetical protein
MDDSDEEEEEEDVDETDEERLWPSFSLPY